MHREQISQKTKKMTEDELIAWAIDRANPSFKDYIVVSITIVSILAIIYIFIS